MFKHLLKAPKKHIQYTCNQPLYKANVELSTKFTLFPWKSRNTITLNFFLLPQMGMSKYSPKSSNLSKVVSGLKVVVY